MSSAAETKKKHATKLIDATRKFMQLMIGKPFYFSSLVRIDDATPSLKFASTGKTTCKTVMVYAGDIWCFLDNFR